MKRLIQATSRSVFEANIWLRGMYRGRGGGLVKVEVELEVEVTEVGTAMS